MPSLGIGELLVVGIILLVAVGPERLPHVTRTLGRLYGRLRRAADELRRALVLEADRMDEEDRLRDLRRRRQEADAERQARAEQTGGRAQPESGDGAAAVGASNPADAPITPLEGRVPEVIDEADDTAADALVAIPPGFTPEEWAEQPEHIRELIARGRKDA
ncbi:MAG: twin-arginine translocase TatA/TatE family subunit [Alphaproteobacteria bacterium]|nr:twin-arginine translocase TatA/TatE family subunit [Alphaproteobacteria bacterium]